MKVEHIKEIILDQNPMAELLDGFDEALVGTGKKNNKEIIAIYDTTKIIEILIKKYQNEIEAIQTFNKILSKGYTNVNSPIFINDFRHAKDITDEEINKIINKLGIKKE